MNDPWDVKSVRQSGQYISCMKISGVPLLPPVLSKECRKEMQYYKLLAKEVEKRISILQPYVFDSCSSSSEVEDPTEAPELPECEQNYDLSLEETHLDFDVNVDKIRAMSPPPRDNETLIDNVGSPKSPSKFLVDVNKNINTTIRESRITSPRNHSPPPREIPERDYNCIKRVTQKVITEKQVITEVETNRNIRKKSKVHEDNFDQVICNEPVSDPFSDIPLPQDGPSSLSSKSFTGSLNDLHSESIKESNSGKLIRQRSYTLLKPSPQLLAHLEVHSQNTGVEMSSISMSESLSNISSPHRKRRSWDLESAKVKWSTMALELKQKNVVNVISKSSVSKTITKPSPKNIYLQRAKSVTPNPIKRNTMSPKPMSKSEPLPNTRKSFSPVRNKNNDRGVKAESTSRVNDKNGNTTKPVSTPISESEDPAARVRELYEKIQKQQLAQMASLVEKQKKEQILLQQVFEEQNNLLFKQLKTICPKSPIEAKEAWGDQVLCEGDRGPVSLSQVINYKSPDNSSFGSPVSSTLTDTNNYISHCDNVLKKSRDITGSLKKPQAKSLSQNGTKIQSPRTQPEGSRTRTHSPVRKIATSRKLNYDSSASTDRDYDQLLTDRTNDTLADLNVTFPSDHSENGNASVIHNTGVVSHLCGKETRTNIVHSAQTNPSLQSRTTENAAKNLERSISGSMNSISTRSSKTPVFKNPPTAKEQAAATKIVAHVKGYLVRRLMRTDRVQGIVQTIKDALLCALQLHQDREGIRGADVDLHRRLIQQITAACYSLHDTFVASTPAERCAMIAADRGKRRRSIASRTPNNSFRQTDIMSQSHTGSFPARAKSRPPPSLMTQSNYETFSGDKSSPVSRRYMSSPRRRPWR